MACLHSVSFSQLKSHFLDESLNFKLSTECFPYRLLPLKYIVGTLFIMYKNFVRGIVLPHSIGKEIKVQKE